jgi:hypothetical protein
VLTAEPPVVTARGAADPPPPIPDSYRILATTLHQRGDVHQWVVPLAWLRPSPAAAVPRPDHNGNLRFFFTLRGEAAECTTPLATVCFSFQLPVPPRRDIDATGPPADVAPSAVECLERTVDAVKRDASFAGTVPAWALATACVRVTVSATHANTVDQGFVPWRYALFAALCETATSAVDVDMDVVPAAGAASPPVTMTIPEPATLDDPMSVDNPTPPPSPPPSAAAASPAEGLPLSAAPHPNKSRKRALLVGVSRYRRRAPTDLEFCNEDVANWHRYLTARGFAVEILGDEFSPYPVWHGAGTVINVREALQRMVADANGPDDRLAFVVSSHGSGDMKGDSYICLLPDPKVGRTPDERTGVYHDHEIAADLSGGATAPNRARNFITFDLCLSGGIIEELLQALPRVVGTTTSTRSGVGFDSQTTHSGAWTHYFLNTGLGAVRAAENPDLVAVFREAHRNHTAVFRRAADRPCFFARSSGAVYNTEPDPNCALPSQTFMAADWL